MSDEVLIKALGVLGGMVMGGFGLIRYYLHARVSAAKKIAKIEKELEDEKAKVLQAKTDTFRKEVDRLDGITGTLSDRLLTCAMDVREHSAQLKALQPDINSLKKSNPALAAKIAELHGQVTILVNDFAMARNRLKERPLEGSGGKTKLEGEKKP